MRLETEFVKLPLRFDAKRLAAEVAAMPEAAWRPHPQGYPGNSALSLIAAGGDPAEDPPRDDERGLSEAEAKDREIGRAHV